MDGDIALPETGIIDLGGDIALRETGIIDPGDVNSSSAVDLTDQIPFHGPSPVSDYFKPKPTGIEVDGVNVKEAYFRGRKLQDTTVPLPDGYSDEDEDNVGGYHRFGFFYGHVSN